MLPALVASPDGRIVSIASIAARYVEGLGMRGSQKEVETHLQIAVRLEYIDRLAARPAWFLLQDTGRLPSIEWSD